MITFQSALFESWNIFTSIGSIIWFMPTYVLGKVPITTSLLCIITVKRILWRSMSFLHPSPACYISSDGSSRHMIVCLIALFLFLSLHVEQSRLSVTVDGAVLEMCEKSAVRWPRVQQNKIHLFDWNIFTNTPGLVFLAELWFAEVNNLCSWYDFLNVFIFREVSHTKWDSQRTATSCKAQVTR